MTTQPSARPASLPGGVTGFPGQRGTWNSSRTSMSPLCVHAALTTASCPAQVRTSPVSVMMLSWASAFTSLQAGQVSYEL